MKISIWWLPLVFYAGLFLGIFVVSLCRAAKGNGEPLTDEKLADMSNQIKGEGFHV